MAASEADADKKKMEAFELATMSHEDFAFRALPLWGGVQVVIALGDHSFTLPLELLATQSPYMERVFKGDFKEAAKGRLVLETMKDVVTLGSVTGMVQWFCLDRINFTYAKDRHLITAIINLLRLADMWDVTGGIQNYLCLALEDNLKPHRGGFSVSCGRWDFEGFPYYLIAEHVKSAFLLPIGSRVQQILTEALFEAYLKKNGEKFQELIRDCPGFSSAMCEALKAAMIQKGIGYWDPFHGGVRLL